MTRFSRQGVLAAVALVLASSAAHAQKAAVTPADTKLAPSKMWAAHTSPSEVTLVWAPVKGATGYEVHARKPDGSNVKIMQVAGATVSRIVIPVARLIAAGLLNEEAVRMFLVVTGPKSSVPAWFNEIFVGDAKSLARPATPTNVQLRESSPRVLTLTWSEVPGATAYNIGRAAGNEGFRRFCDLCPTGGQLVDTVSATGVPYVYSIVAVGPGGTSPRATSPAVTPTGIILAGPIGDAAPTGGDSKDAAADDDSKDAGPGAPTELKSAVIVNDKGRRGVRLSWVVGVRTTVYQVLRAACNGPLQVIARVEPPSVPISVFPTMEFVDYLTDGLIDQRCRQFRYELKGLNPKGAVTARFAEVDVGDASGGTGAGTAGGGTTGGSTGGGTTAVPAAPASRASQVLSGHEVRLTWQRSPSATSYRIERALGTSGWQPLATLSGDATSFTDARTGLVKLNPKYRISAVNAAGASAAVSFP